MRAIRRRLFQGEADDLGDPLIVDRARSPRARFVVEAVEPMLGKAPTPLADRVRVGTSPAVHNRLVLQPIGRRQYDPRPPCQTLKAVLRRRAKPSNSRRSEADKVICLPPLCP